jgi:outer membrane protein assembly factor BamB
MVGAARRIVVLAVGMSLSAGLAGCSAPDTVTPGERPNKPTSTAAPGYSEETDPEKLDIPPSDVQAYQQGAKDAAGWTSGMMLGGGEFKWRTMDADGQSSEPDTTTVAWGAAQTYTDGPGVLTFRGNHYRDAAAYGTADVTEKKLEIVWTQEIGEVRGEDGYFPGAGWTGQPLIVNWPEVTRKAMFSGTEYEDKDLVEVLYPVFDGKVYRLDLATGEQTKEPIEGSGGFKGTGSVDPRGYPLLYTGQGLDDMNGVQVPFRYRIFDLIANKEISGWSGNDDPARPRNVPAADGKAANIWGAFDSSALVNGPSDTLVEPSENGLVYKVKLNTHFDADAKTVTVDPKLSRMEYRTPTSKEYGIESSAVAYHNLMYATDNDGNLICWDADTLALVWAVAVGDDSDASLVLEEADGEVYLYTGNEVDLRRTSGQNVTNLRKFNALSGELVWQYDVPTAQIDPGSVVQGGEFATPLLGKGEISDLIIYNVAKTSDSGLFCVPVINKCTGNWGGKLIALDKKTGKPVWTRELADYSWSSPIAITGDDGHQYGVFGDSAGMLHLFDPNTGEDLDTVSLEKNIEASPAAYGNMIVVASYAKKIWAIRIS